MDGPCYRKTCPNFGMGIRRGAGCRRDAMSVTSNAGVSSGALQRTTNPHLQRHGGWYSAIRSSGRDRPLAPSPLIIVRSRADGRLFHSRPWHRAGGRAGIGQVQPVAVAVASACLAGVTVRSGPRALLRSREHAPAHIATGTADGPAHSAHAALVGPPPTTNTSSVKPPEIPTNYILAALKPYGIGAERPAVIRPGYPAHLYGQPQKAMQIVH
jgi:hypothetical protein